MSLVATYKYSMLAWQCIPNIFLFIENILILRCRNVWNVHNMICAILHRFHSLIISGDCDCKQLYHINFKLYFVFMIVSPLLFFIAQLYKKQNERTFIRDSGSSAI